MLDDVENDLRYREREVKNMDDVENDLRYRGSKD